MPKLVIIRGNCGVGKSTITKAITRKNWILLDYDLFLWNFTVKKKLSDQDYELAFKNFMAVLKNVLVLKKTVILEGVLVPRSKKDPLDVEKVIRLTKRHGYEIKRILLTVSENEAKKQMKERKWIVPKQEYESFKRKLQKSHMVKEQIIDTTKDSMQQSIKKILKIL